MRWPSRAITSNLDACLSTRLKSLWTQLVHLHIQEGCGSLPAFTFEFDWHQLARLPKLQQLSLSAKVSTVDFSQSKQPPGYLQLNQLTKLVLENCRVINCKALQVSALPRLQSLTLAKCPPGPDTTVSTLSACSSHWDEVATLAMLTHLSLGHAVSPGPGLEKLTGLQQLKLKVVDYLSRLTALSSSHPSRLAQPIREFCLMRRIWATLIP